MRELHAFFLSDKVNGNLRFNFIGSTSVQLAAFATGYHRAGQTLARALAGRHFPDYEGYPVMFLYRHSLELYFKAIAYRGADLLGLVGEQTFDFEKLYARHDLTRFLPALKTLFDSLGWKWDFDVAGLNSWTDFECLVRSVDSLDPGSYAFRYPIKRGGEPTFERHLVLNVFAFARGMDPVLDLLHSAASGVEDAWDGAAEAQYELQQLMSEWSTRVAP